MLLRGPYEKGSYSLRDPVKGHQKAHINTEVWSSVLQAHMGRYEEGTKRSNPGPREEQDSDGPGSVGQKRHLSLATL